MNYSQFLIPITVFIVIDDILKPREFVHSNERDKYFTGEFLDVNRKFNLE